MPYGRPGFAGACGEAGNGDRLAGWDGDAVLRYITPYTPELNPAGVQWYIIKKVTANVLYGRTDAMESVGRMLRGRETGVAKMSHYLLG